MNFQPIHFNQSEALKAGGNGNFFAGNSEQLVKITRAEFVKSQTGSQGISFDVVNKDKQRGYFSYYYQRADGSVNEVAHRQLQALMGVCGVTVLTPTQMTVEKYDQNSKAMIQVNCINAKELIGKKFVGLFIDEFEVYNGEKRKKTELYVAFNENRQSYREMNAQQPPNDIEHLTQTMLKKSVDSELKVDNELSRNQGYDQTPDWANGQGYQPFAQGQQNAYTPQQNGYPQPQGNLQPSPADDDIPF